MQYNAARYAKRYANSRRENSTDMMDLPPAKIGLVVGTKGRAIRAISEQSGAHVHIDGYKAIIRGSKEAIKEARRLIAQKIRLAPNVQPHIGYTVLELPACDGLPKIEFTPYDYASVNRYHRKQSYRVKFCNDNANEKDFFGSFEDGCDSNGRLPLLAPHSPYQSHSRLLSSSNPSPSSSQSSSRIFSSSHSRSSSVTSVTSSNNTSSSLQRSLNTLTDRLVSLAITTERSPTRRPERLPAQPSDAQTFTITQYLPTVISAVSSHLFKVNPNISIQHEARVSLFFGRETFSEIDRIRLDTIENWCVLNRDRHGFRSSFLHHVPDMVENLSKVLKKFGFKRSIQNKRSGNVIKKGGRNNTDNCGDSKNEVDQGNPIKDNNIYRENGSVCINYDEGDGIGKKLKLHWDCEKGVYKATKMCALTRRIAIVDIVHGTSAPDIRFLLKTHEDEDIDPAKVELISELQKPPLKLFDGTYFQSKHLKERLSVDSIRQIVMKQKFVNDRFQLSIITNRKESRISPGNLSEPVEEQTVHLKHLSWKLYQTNDEIRQVYDRQSLEHSIRETVAFARKISKILEG
ncbi:7719_t:CDS:2 [Paraglomus occultum]|uniref:7719_t:CDS:1 n=1 Tax=Paraglomus occultum TaxID=144539 RepID=A0A9N8Z5D1_9GLOM|nr:7719_t:CDS:2 [Paraglomus occultum]